MSSTMVLMPVPMGAFHFSGIPSSPYSSPQREPMVAAVQSVSSPQFTVMQMVRSKSPSPYSQPMSSIAMLDGTS